ncbi:MAG: sigma-70 family RNA polymerase sigma factor [bacterium]|nr:sigma-70 family RNA polymerase sigma factor [bacterium]
MSVISIEALFSRYRLSGDPAALGAVFDRLAPELTLVAGHLAGSDAAEDVVQATFLDAIRQRERWDDSRPLAPWLIGLLGNHVRRVRRARQRVPDPSRLTTRASAVPADEAAANEAIAEVHAAVERLPRQYRQVMTLRLVHGLQLQQIATSLGVPLGTVKVRLHRGLGLLRRALPAGLASSVALLTISERGLAAVRHVVVAHAGALGGSTAAAATAVSALFGGWIMKNVAVGVAVGVLLAAGWLGFSSWRAPQPLDPADAEDAVTAGAAEIEREEPAAQPRPATDAVRDHAPVRRRPEGAAFGALAVKVLWRSDRSPAKGVAISLRSVRARATITVGRSGEDGSVEFSRLDAGQYQVTSSPLEGSYDVAVAAGKTALCEVLVADEHRLRVLVVDNTETPRSGAAVWGTDFIGNEVPRRLGVTDAAGVLNYRGPRLDSVWARQRGRQPSARHLLDPGDIIGGATAEDTATLVLGGAGCTLLGRVVDPDGRAVAEARVAIAVVDSWSNNSDPSELVLVTGADGHFGCDELPAGERFVAASHPGFAPAVQRVTTSAEPAVVTLPLQVGASLTGRVTDANDAPVAGVSVRAFSSTALVGIRGPWGNRPETYTDLDGRFSLSGIPAGTTRGVVMLMPHIAKSFTLADAETRIWDVRQAPEVALHGTVVGPEGEPLAGWSVELIGGAGFLDHAMHLGSTDPAGKFRIGGLRDRSYQARVFAPIEARKGVPPSDRGFPRVVLTAVRPSPDPLEIRVDHAAMANGAIEGSVVLPDAASSAVTISLTSVTTAGTSRRQLEPGETSFRFGSLPAGDYQVTCEMPERGRIQSPTFTLHAGQSFVLQPFEPGLQRPAEIVLRHADGRPCEAATVMLMPGMITCSEVSPGHYRSRPLSAGTMTASVYGPGFAPTRFSFSTADSAARTMAAAATVEVELEPAIRRQQWRNLAIVSVKDGQGVEVLSGILKIAGEESFVWRLGLPPGVYDVNVRCSDGAAAKRITVGGTAMQVKMRLRQ